MLELTRPNEGEAFAPSIPPQEYVRIVAGINIGAIGLTSCQCQLHNRMALVNRADEIRPVLDMHAVCQSFEQDASWVMVAVQHFTVRFFWNEDVVMLLSCGFQVDYVSPEEFTQEFFDVYGSLALPTHTIPYAREMFQSLTSRMNVPVFVLPLFRPDDVLEESQMMATSVE